MESIKKTNEPESLNEQKHPTSISISNGGTVKTRHEAPMNKCRGFAASGKIVMTEIVYEVCFSLKGTQGF